MGKHAAVTPRHTSQSVLPVYSRRNPSFFLFINVQQIHGLLSLLRATKRCQRPPVAASVRDAGKQEDECAWSSAASRLVVEMSRSVLNFHYLQQSSKHRIELPRPRAKRFHANPSIRAKADTHITVVGKESPGQLPLPTRPPKRKTVPHYTEHVVQDESQVLPLGYAMLSKR